MPLPWPCATCWTTPPYTGAGAIEVRLEPHGVVRVVNDGPIVPTGGPCGLTQRFARGRTDVAGSGLGLAIVETIMEQSGGRLTLASPAPGRDGGFEARLELRCGRDFGPPQAGAGRPAPAAQKNQEVQA